MTSHFGKYEIIRTIGKGAMGEVFLAKDPLLNRDVAIKTILADGGFGEDAMTNFINEAKATAALNHPNIVTVFDFGQHEDMAYLVMEYVEGDTLEALIANGTSKQILLEVLVEACDGLAYAHQRGLVHRDIKPGNVLVSMRGKKHYAKLVDFGVAQERGTQQDDGELIGTIYYVAPEYLKSGHASISSDLFAIGVILYEILSGGKRPFGGEDTTVVLGAILSQEPAPLTAISLGGLPTGLLQVVKRALDKEPTMRFQDAEALGQAILDALKQPTAHTTAAIKPEMMNVVVGKGGQATCLSLRVALRQVAPGGQIRILPGVYKESIVLDKGVAIVGEGDPTKVVIESTGPPAIMVKSGRSIIKDLTLRASDDVQIDSLIDVAEGQLTLKNCVLKTMRSCAVIVESGAEISMQDCIAVGHGSELVVVRGSAELYGGHYSGATRAAITLLDKGHGVFQHVQMGPGDGVGILLDDYAKAELDNVVLSGFDEGGMELNLASVVHAKESRFLSSKYAGLIQKGQTKSKMEACHFNEHEGSGVHITNEAEVQLFECRLSDNASYGISVLGGGSTTLDSCEISRNAEIGVVLHHQGKIQLSQCRILDSAAVGVHCYSNTEANLEFCEIKGSEKQGVQVDTAGYVALKQCVVRENKGSGICMEDGADVFLESCVVQQNTSGSIIHPKGAKPPTLLGNNHLEAYTAN